MKKKILVVDDERAIRSAIKDILSLEGYHIDEAEDGVEALKKIKLQDWDCILCDIKMPKMDGLELLANSMKIAPQTPFIIISGHGNIETAVQAVKNGAYDFIAKPPDLNRLLITIRNAMDKKFLLQETEVLKTKIAGKSFSKNLIGSSPALMEVINSINKVAPTDARVLITGENGVGKELVAIKIHELSKRKNAPFIEVNCAAIPIELIESELFGHEKGSFTSAVKQRAGKFEQAHGGTLFLDEIGDMSLNAQAKVLRALQEGKISRVGGEKDITVDVRIISATNKNLYQEVEDKNFRLDLFHRLSVIAIKMPPLRERLTDIADLASHFLKEICRNHNKPLKTINPEAMEALKKHKWYGNVRELKNGIERLVIFGEKEITMGDVNRYILNS